MTDKSKGKRLYENLLSSLANAPRGDIKLDVMIAYYLGNIQPSYRRAANLLVDKGFAWELIANLWEGDLPLHTRSLDAALPGENITAVVSAGENRRWAAIHTCEAGQEYVARASTEALARRLAVLRWLRPERVISTSCASDTQGATPDKLPPRAEATRRDWSVTAPVAPVQARITEANPQESGGWKIRF